MNENCDRYKAQRQISNRAWQEANKKNVSSYKKAKVVCECGSTISRDCMAKHGGTTKHKNRMEHIQNMTSPQERLYSITV